MTSYADDTIDFKFRANIGDWKQIDDNIAGVGEYLLQCGSVQSSTQAAKDVLTSIPMISNINNMQTNLYKRVRNRQHNAVRHNIYYTNMSLQLCEDLNQVLGNLVTVPDYIPMWNNPFVFDIEGATYCVCQVENVDDVYNLEGSEALDIVKYNGDSSKPRRYVRRKVYEIDPLARTEQLDELDQEKIAKEEQVEIDKWNAMMKREQEGQIDLDDNKRKKVKVKAE